VEFRFGEPKCLSKPGSPASAGFAVAGVKALIYFRKDLFIDMWKPTNSPSPTPSTPNPEPQRSYTPPVAEAPRPSAPVTTTQEQATLGKSLVIKGEVTGSESLYIDGRVEGSINLPGNRVTVGRNGVVAANILAREVVVMGKVTGNIECSDRVDIRSEGSLTGDVISRRISVEDGAILRGSVQLAPADKQEKSSRSESPKAMAAVAGK
jgi:cytoskeletal protein CcmA (bactofilin family)